MKGPLTTDLGVGWVWKRPNEHPTNTHGVHQTSREGLRKKRSVGSLTQRRAGLVFTSVSRSLPPPKSEIKINIPTILKSSQRKPKRRALEKGCLRRVLPLRHGITREHSIAPACVRWNDQIRCFGGEIESRISDRDSRQIDRHTLSPTAVLAATDPNLLNYGPTAVADTTSCF